MGNAIIAKRGAGAIFCTGFHMKKIYIKKWGYTK